MHTKMTYLDYAALPEDGRRYELIDGVLIEMAAPTIRHQRILGELGGQLRQHGCDYVIAPFDIRLPKLGENANEAKTVVQPDLSVYCNSDHYDDKAGKCAPDLAIEILSPSSITHDCVRKLQLYEKHGFKEYWIVDGDRRLLSVYRHDGQQFAPVESFAFDCLVPVYSVPGLSLDLSLLASVLDRSEKQTPG